MSSKYVFYVSFIYFVQFLDTVEVLNSTNFAIIHARYFFDLKNVAAMESERRKCKKNFDFYIYEDNINKVIINFQITQVVKLKLLSRFTNENLAKIN